MVLIRWQFNYNFFGATLEKSQLNPHPNFPIKLFSINKTQYLIPKLNETHTNWDFFNPNHKSKSYKKNTVAINWFHQGIQLSILKVSNLNFYSKNL